MATLAQNVGLKSSIAEGRWWALLLVNGGIGAAAALYLVNAPRLYDSVFQIKQVDSESKVTTNSNEEGVANITDNNQALAGAEQIDPAQVQRELLLSNGVIAPVARALNLTPRQTTDMIQAKPVYKTGLLQVSVRGNAPEQAQKSANILLSTYLNRVAVLRREEIAGRKQVYQKALADAGHELAVAEMSLARVRAQTGLLDDNTYFQETVRMLLALQQQRVVALSQLQAGQVQAQSLGAEVGTTVAQASDTLRLSSYQPYRNARQDLDKVERQLAQLQARFTDANPRVAALLEERKKLEELVRRREKELFPSKPPASAGIYSDDANAVGTRSTLLSQLLTNRAQAQGLKAQVQAIDSEIVALKRKIRDLPLAQQKISEARRRFLIAQGVFNNALAQYQSTRLAELTTAADVVIVDPPSLPTEPSSPRPLVVIAGALAAAFFATVSILGWRRRRAGGLRVQDDWLVREQASVPGRSL